MLGQEELDQFNIHVSRYRPEELTKLMKTTKFTRKEIQLIYRGFKQRNRTSTPRQQKRLSPVGPGGRNGLCLAHLIKSRFNEALITARKARGLSSMGIFATNLPSIPRNELLSSLLVEGGPDGVVVRMTDYHAMGPELDSLRGETDTVT
ncbi:hypothetical protein AAG570_002928 [Ranatra chinensis]|uniref:Uncharacterized protein n=1 Tax=Ranatra chinensis TaxID=642074 RepID=A0ABD0Y594_9HEMI